MEIARGNLLPEALMLGLPDIDAQHEGVFWRIETLKFTCIEENALSEPLLDELLRFLHEHFASEESLAASISLDFTHHHVSHRHTLDMLRRWGDKVIGGELDVFSFLRYLEIWFERHIQHEDQPFAREVLARGRVKSG